MDSSRDSPVQVERQPPPSTTFSPPSLPDVRDPSPPQPQAQPSSQSQSQSQSDMPPPATSPLPASTATPETSTPERPETNSQQPQPNGAPPEPLPAQTDEMDTTQDAQQPDPEQPSSNNHSEPNGHVPEPDSRDATMDESNAVNPPTGDAPTENAPAESGSVTPPLPPPPEQSEEPVPEDRPPPPEQPQEPEEEEEEPAYWADIEEDTSAPDEEELKEIETGDQDYSAYDYGYWEEGCFKPLDDPEYKPTEKARVTWKIKGVRGTKENPNRAVIMRSPSAFVGGYWWTLKFFPRGNSVSALSIYIECSTTRPEMDEEIPETEFRVLRGDPDQDLSQLTPDEEYKLPARKKAKKESKPEQPEQAENAKEEATDAQDGSNGAPVAPNSSADDTADTVNGTTDGIANDTANTVNDTTDEATNNTADTTDGTANDTTNDVVNGTTDEVPNDSADDTANNSKETPNDSSEDDAPDDKEKKVWRVSAEVAVIVYNPEEPRTGWFQSACHQFNPHNVDWGWTHFHGPWDQIHVRQRGQRQALLRNDTLAFDAYIRIVDDPTRTLWWHSCDAEPTWDSVGLTGYWPLGDESDSYKHEIAGLASWLMLSPVRQIIQDVDILEHIRNPDVKPRPLCTVLQRFLWCLRTQTPDTQPFARTSDVTDTLRNYREASRDVAGFWHLLRRNLQLELEGTDAAEKFAALFDSPEISPEVNRLPREFNSRITLRAEKTKDVQSGVGDYLNERPGKWSLPTVLHVELARQSFDSSSRQWQMCFNRVQMSDELDLSSYVPEDASGKYTLYGYIVHKGQRASGRYYPVLRPGGPGALWLGFEDTGEPKITPMTRKAAVEAHEGIESKDVSEKRPPDVAVMVLYIRTDLLSTCLPAEPESWAIPKLREYYLQHAETSLKLALEETGKDTVAIEFHTLDSSQLAEIGSTNSIFDSYDLMAMARSAGKHRTLHLSPDVTFTEMRREFAAQESEATGRDIDPEDVRFWKVGPGRVNWPHSLQFESVGDLGSNISLFGLDVLNLWVRFLDQESKLFAQLNPPPPRQEPEPEQQGEPEQENATTNEEPATVAPIEAETDEGRREPEIEDVVMTDDDPAEGEQGQQDAPGETPAQNPSTEEPQPEPERQQEEDTPMDSVPAQGANEDISSADQAAIAALIAGDLEELDRNQESSAEQASVPDTTDQEAINPPAETTEAAQSMDNPSESQTDPEIQQRADEDIPMENSNEPTRDRPDDDESESHVDDEEDTAQSRRPGSIHISQQIYYFIQLFDAEKQELRLQGSYLADRNESVRASVRNALGWDKDREFLLWKREDGASMHSVSGDPLFEDAFSYPVEACCLIVGDTLTSDEKTKLAESGQFSSPRQLLRYHWSVSRQHPVGAFTGDKTIEASYGGHYYSGSFKNGRWHGQGTHISDTGATYTGNFVLSHRQGHGKMEYATGDTYEGDWLRDQRHGQGTFIELKTGNKYVGGYRDGKRHGKGISYWEVADEEMGLCQICYVEDQDALFYPCGHVCACVECARQLDICPMCRKKAVNVVRIYRS